MDDGLGASGHQRFDSRGLHVAVGVNNVHLGQAGDAVDVELGLQRVALDGGAEPVVLALHHHAQGAPLALEGLGLDVDVLVNVAAALDLVVHGDEHALATCVLAGRHAHGAVQVQRTVSRQGRARAHGADQHDGLVRVHREVQEIRRFFHGVGAMGDDDAIHIRLLGQGRNALTQLEQMVVGEAFRGDLEHLLARHLGHIGQLWQARQQFVHRHLGGCVGRAVGGRCARTSDGAAGGQHHHMGLGRLRERDGRQGRKHHPGKPAAGDGRSRRSDGHR